MKYLTIYISRIKELKMHGSQISVKSTIDHFQNEDEKHLPQIRFRGIAMFVKHNKTNLGFNITVSMRKI